MTSIRGDYGFIGEKFAQWIPQVTFESRVGTSRMPMIEVCCT